MKTIRPSINPTPSLSLARWLPALVMAALYLAGMMTARAAKIEFERTKPHMSVGSIGHVELREPVISFDFAADLETKDFGGAAGGIQLAFADGSVKTYQAKISRVQLEGHQALVFFLLFPALSTDQFDQTKPATAFARDSSDGTRDILWDLAGLEMSPQNLHFRVPGEIRIISRNETQPERHPRLWFDLQYRLQQVKILGTDILSSFRTSARVFRDHTANGLVELGFPDNQQPLRFEPIFGSAVDPRETGPGYIILLLEGAPLLFENLAVATVRPDPALPGCDIWDFQNNPVAPPGGSPFHVQFDAEGRIRFHGLPPDDPPSDPPQNPTFSSRSEE
ncbi:MAG: hypothetical protein L0Z50_07250 [Verrucomicrobiales bacterium]|nr:hypothetical protein [Verrucomicrobiales bacterium]